MFKKVRPTFPSFPNLYCSPFYCPPSLLKLPSPTLFSGDFLLFSDTKITVKNKSIEGKELRKMAESNRLIRALTKTTEHFTPITAMLTYPSIYPSHTHPVAPLGARKDGQLYCGHF